MRSDELRQGAASGEKNTQKVLLPRVGRYPCLRFFLFNGVRQPHIAEAIVCWCVLGLVAVYLIGIFFEVVLAFVIGRMSYQVGVDKRAVSIFWRKGKGNLRYERRALRRVTYKTDAKSERDSSASSSRKNSWSKFRPKRTSSSINSANATTANTL